jgi:glycosyltransferase involved in cell wall biosynthesis
VEKPLFSIVIPTYNRQELVSYAIESVIHQTFDDFEIIVCDNFSTDNTAMVVDQFKDSRIKYIRTPHHFVIADNWEFARKQASGKLVIMLSDDDALVSTALETVCEEYRRHHAEFIFFNIAEYRDNGFPGPERNIFDCPPFSGTSRIIQTDELINSVFNFKFKFNMHPSGFVFDSNIGELVAIRSGRFFQTNGVEYFAWPLAAVLSKTIVYIDLPLVICGRTKKSWGSNIRFCNPGRKRIKKLIDDVDKRRNNAPLNNFTMCNLMADGMLTAKKLYPKEFEKYVFDEAQYIMATIEELRDRKRLGVDVSIEMEDIKNYLSKNPCLKNEISRREALKKKKTFWKAARSVIGDVGVRKVIDRVRKPLQTRTTTKQDALKLKRGEVNSGLRISGMDFGFNDILGCADFLARITAVKR